MVTLLWSKVTLPFVQSYPAFATTVILPWPKVTLLSLQWLPYLCHYGYPTLAQSDPTFTTIVPLP
jgi:hypothetical protein